MYLYFNFQCNNYLGVCMCGCFGNMCNCKWTKSNEMQQYADIYLLQVHSTCFGCLLQHPPSGIHETVTVASGTGHNIWATNKDLKVLIWLRWRKVVAQILWPVPEAAVTVLCTPDDGCGRHPKHVELLCSKLISAYCCSLLDFRNLELRCKEPRI